MVCVIDHVGGTKKCILSTHVSIYPDITAQNVIRRFVSMDQKAVIKK